MSQKIIFDKAHEPYVVCGFSRDLASMCAEANKRLSPPLVFDVNLVEHSKLVDQYSQSICSTSVLV